MTPLNDEYRLQELREELTELLLNQNDCTRELATLKVQIKQQARRITDVSDEIDALYAERNRTR